MKILNVHEKVGSVVLTETSGRDLFGFLLELYLEDDRDDEIDVNFKDVMSLGSSALNSFINLSRESKVLPLYKLRAQVLFSGLFVNDITTLAKAFDENKKPDEEAEGIKKQFEDAFSQLKGNAEGNADVSKFISNFLSSDKKDLNLTDISNQLEKLGNFIKKV